MCIFPDDHHHRNSQYEQKHNHTHSAPALDTTQMTDSGSAEGTHPDGLDELRPMATTGNSVAAGPGSEHGTEMNPSEAESYTVIIRYDGIGGLVGLKFQCWHALCEGFPESCAALPVLHSKSTGTVNSFFCAYL